MAWHYGRKIFIRIAAAFTVVALILFVLGSLAPRTLPVASASPPPPTIGSVTPITGPTTGGLFVTISGSGFTTGTQVEFGTTPSPTVHVINTSLLTAETPEHVRGGVSVKVMVSGQQATETFGFFYTYPVLAITRVTPSSGPTYGGQAVTVYGGGFSTKATGTLLVSAVSFGGPQATTLSVSSQSVLKVITPANTLGFVTVELSTNTHTRYETKKTAFDYVLPVPEVTKITPPFGPTTGGTKVAIQGNDFVTHTTTISSVTEITFGGTRVSPTAVSPTRITITTPAHGAGSVSVTVTFTTRTVVLKKDGYTYIADQPTLTGVTPPLGPTVGGTHVTLTGTYFTTTLSKRSVVTTVTFGGARATTLTVESGTKLTVVAPPHNVGPVTVQVSATNGVAKKTSAFTYVVATVPSTPLNPTLVAGDGEALATWIVPNNGNRQIEGFVINVTDNGKSLSPLKIAAGTTTGPLSPVPGFLDTYWITTLPNGEPVFYTIAASNAQGDGAMSLHSPTVVPKGPPARPDPVTAVAGDKQAEVTWKVPNNEGSPISSFELVVVLHGKGSAPKSPILIKANKFGAASRIKGAEDHETIRGLTDGSSYSFTVSATNAIGTGEPGVSNRVTPHSGFWEVTAKGRVYAFGNARNYGTLVKKHLSHPIIGITATPNNGGYWLAASNGAVYAFGNARNFGSKAGEHLNKPVDAISDKLTGNGYFLAAKDGGVFTYGAGGSQFFGSTGSFTLLSPVVAMAVYPTGHGYWLVDARGFVIGFGDAHFYGSVKAKDLKGPVVGIAQTPTGKGYWVVSQSGQVFSFGKAQHFGDLGPTKPGRGSKVIGIASTLDGQGYWIARSNGAVVSFGDAETYRGIRHHVTSPVVSIAEMH